MRTIKFPDTLIKVIALERNRFSKEKPIGMYEYENITIRKGDVFLVESDDFLRGYFNLYTLNKEYLCRASNNGYDFITLENWREKQIKSVLS
jgi:hypothetical protein